MSAPSSPRPKPEAAVSAAEDAVPTSPEEGMKTLNALMADMLAEAERGAMSEKKVETRLLSLLKDMRGYREVLAAKKQDYLARLSHIRGMLVSNGGGPGGANGDGVAEVGPKSEAEQIQLGHGPK